MAETAKPAEAEKVDSGPKSGSFYEETVTVLTGAFDVSKPSLIEEAGKTFIAAAKKNGVTIDPNSLRLIAVNHRVGKSAEYTFEGKVK